MEETKQHPSLLPGPAVPVCSLFSFHFLSAILCLQAVYYWLRINSLLWKFLKKIDSRLFGVGIDQALLGTSWHSATSLATHTAPLPPRFEIVEASVLMQRPSYPTETVLSNNTARNRIVLSFKDSSRKPLGRRPTNIKGHRVELSGREKQCLKIDCNTFSSTLSLHTPFPSLPDTLLTCCHKNIYSARR